MLPPDRFSLSVGWEKSDINGPRCVWFFSPLLDLKEQSPVVLSALCETMLGRHVKPGNGRKRKRAVWPPLTHLLGNTRKQETGKGGGWDTGVSAKGGKG